MAIYLLRHATPDWTRKDIPYDIPPGPPLSPKGEREATALAEFLKTEGVVRLYFSPFERSARTARIIAAVNGIPCTADGRLAEWRSSIESDVQVLARMQSRFADVCVEAQAVGAIGLVSHGGPVSILLQQLGLQGDELIRYQNMFDRPNPIPPAGAWKIERNEDTSSWRLSMVFIPRAD